MKVLIEYGYNNDNMFLKKPVRVSETREIDSDCYPYVIGKILREFYDRGHDIYNIRCLDAHPKDMP